MPVLHANQEREILYGPTSTPNSARQAIYLVKAKSVYYSLNSPRPPIFDLGYGTTSHSMLSIGSFADKPSIAMEKSLTLVGRAAEIARDRLLETPSAGRQATKRAATALGVVIQLDSNCHQRLILL